MQSHVVTHLHRSGENPDVLLGVLEKGLGGASPKLVLVFASPQIPLKPLVATLRGAFPDATLLGSTSAGEFTEAGKTSGSASVVAIAGQFEVFSGLGVGLKDDAEQAIDSAVRELPVHLPNYPHRTALLLLDPLAGNGEETALLTMCRFDPDVKLVGGAAGDDMAMARTEIACGSEVASDAVAVGLIFSKEPLGVGVCHGHEPFSEPLRVTRASENVVFEIDGKPAWDIWKQETRSAAEQVGLNVDDLNAGEIRSHLQRYEAGLQLPAGYKIRAPLSLGENGELYFACGIPEGSVIRITESTPERQIESAREAARQAREQLQGKEVAGAVVFDCVCRHLILQKDFTFAVKEMSRQLGGVPIAGFETYGEIALNSGDLSGFHNTTTVVLALP